MSVGVDKPWPRLVARLRAAGIHPNITQVAVETALLREAANALEAAARREADDWLLLNAAKTRAEAAEARAEKAERVVEAARSIVGAHDSEDFLDARGTIEAALDRYGGSVATGRRVIAENAAVLERLGTSGDQTVSEQAIAAEATRLAQSHNLMHKSENPGDRVVGIDAVDGVTPRTLNDVFGLNDPDSGEVIATHACPVKGTSAAIIDGRCSECGASVSDSTNMRAFHCLGPETTP